jgi:hypothetical protein
LCDFRGRSIQIPPRVSTIIRIYWLAEFGDVSCLQLNYLRVETHSDLGGFCWTILRVSTHVLNALEVNINMSLCTRDNRCQGLFTCCRQLPVYDIWCVCSFTCCKKNVEYTNKILFHLQGISGLCRLPIFKKKNPGFTDLWPIRHKQNKT